jgi:Mrp family chromosome partitioning ATPase
MQERRKFRRRNATDPQQTAVADTLRPVDVDPATLTREQKIALLRQAAAQKSAAPVVTDTDVLDRARAREELREKQRQEEAALQAEREAIEAETRRQAEQARLEQEQLEQERLEEERLRQELEDQRRAAEALRLEQERLAEQARLEEQRAEQKALSAAEQQRAQRKDRLRHAMSLEEPPKPKADPAPKADVQAMAEVFDFDPIDGPASQADIKAAPALSLAALHANWLSLPAVDLDPGALSSNLVVSATRDHETHATFDVLRTRLLHALAEKGWRRVAVTSPGANCGKTFTCVNLAASLARKTNCRTVLLDCDMRRPSLHHALGLVPEQPISDMFRGEVPVDQHLLRLGANRIDAVENNLALGLNNQEEPYASEILQSDQMERCLQQIEAQFDPTVMLFDLPPALFFDDVLAMRSHFDAVLMVIGGGLTTPKEIREAERRLGSDTPLLGMVLNHAEDVDVAARYHR